MEMIFNKRKNPKHSNQIFEDIINIYENGILGGKHPTEPVYLTSQYKYVNK